MKKRCSNMTSFQRLKNDCTSTDQFRYSLYMANISKC
jgi:hypothetical protein